MSVTGGQCDARPIVCDGKYKMKKATMEMCIWWIMEKISWTDHMTTEKVSESIEEKRQ